MNKRKQNYPSKILLFGEYTIINGSSALAIPFHGFSASWVYDINKTSHPEIINFINFLKNNHKTYDFLDAENLGRDIEKGWHLKCDIPIGYGLGSSGAVCAAIYDKYKVDDESEISIVQSRLASMEDYFHQNSSGLDPLISYYDSSILKNKESLSFTQIELPLSDINSQHAEWYLLDTQTERRTAPFVKKYREKLQDSSFVEGYVEEMSRRVDLAIEQVIHKRPISNNMATISQLQYDHMSEMILPSIEGIWKQGLESGDFHLKLCGAGGGGMTLISAYNNTIHEVVENLKLISLIGENKY